MVEKQKKEGALYGAFVFDNDSAVVSEYLSSDDYSKFVKVSKEFGFGQGSLVSSLQFYSPEYYSYDLCGNLISKKNNFGKILYGYDAENHLKYISVNGEVCSEYEQDKNGNLLSEGFKNKKIVYSYSPENRMIYYHEIDSDQLTSSSKSFAYDALGRRVLSKNDGSETVRTVYDGFSFDVIKQGPVYENGTFSTVSGFTVNDTDDSSFSEKYRFITDSKTLIKLGLKMNQITKRFRKIKNLLVSRFMLREQFMQNIPIRIFIIFLWIIWDQ